MSTPSAPYVCAVCGAPVVPGARFCAQCGTPFSERPPLRVTAMPAASPPARPVVPPTYAPSPYAPPPERSTAALWVGGVVVLFVAALVGAYLLFAQPAEDRDEAPETVEVAPGPRPATPPPVSADEGLDDGSFPDDEVLDDAFGEDETIEELDLGDEGETAGEEVLIDEGTETPEPNAAAPAESPRMAAAWSDYQGALAAYRQAVQSAGSSDKRQAEVAAACSRLYDAGSAVLRLPGPERYAGQITRDQRDC